MLQDRNVLLRKRDTLNKDKIRQSCLLQQVFSLYFSFVHFRKPYMVASTIMFRILLFRSETALCPLNVDHPRTDQNTSNTSTKPEKKI